MKLHLFFFLIKTISIRPDVATLCFMIAQVAEPLAHWYATTPDRPLCAWGRFIYAAHHRKGFIWPERLCFNTSLKPEVANCRRTARWLILPRALVCKSWGQTRECKGHIPSLNCGLASNLMLKTWQQIVRGDEGVHKIHLSCIQTSPHPLPSSTSLPTQSRLELGRMITGSLTVQSRCSSSVEHCLPPCPERRHRPVTVATEASTPSSQLRESLLFYAQLQKSLKVQRSFTPTWKVYEKNTYTAHWTHPCWKFTFRNTHWEALRRIMLLP